MSYISVLQKLNNCNFFRAGRADLTNIIKLMNLLGNPEKNMKFIHIAGTNGKGSVALKIQKSLQNGNRCIGLFTSPHLFSFRERIIVNDEKIEKDFIVDALPRIYELANKNQIQPIFFEYLTALALLYFQEKQVDFVSWETGLGGRLDSTNCINQPILSVVTSIGYDHQTILGNTLEQIAFEKAGIIKFKTPVVLGYNAQPYQVFLDIAYKMKAPVKIITKKPDTFREENKDIVCESVNQINKIFPNLINDEQLQKGLLFEQPCRMELFQYNKFTIYLDVGHNINAINQLIHDITKIHPNRPIVYIYGASSYKSVKPILSRLGETCSKIFLVEAKNFRAMKIESLQQHILSNQLNFKIFSADVKQTIEHVLSTTDPNSIIIIGGSFYLMTEVKQYFKQDEEFDPFELNYRKQ